MEQRFHRCIVSPHNTLDPLATQLLSNAHILGFHQITQLERHPLYFLEGALTESDQARIAQELLSDPVTQQCHWDSQPTGQIIEAILKPGVTDPIATEILRGAELLKTGKIKRVITGYQFLIHSDQPLQKTVLDQLATQLLINPVIQHYQIGILPNHFPELASIPGKTQTIPLSKLDPQILRQSALDTNEINVIQDYYDKIGRDPTDLEFEMIAQTWSEHCSHKTFRADIDYNGETIHGLLNTYIRAATNKINAPWIVSAFVDNAGIIEFDDEYDLSFKVETHNHPSALEPFGGANTGLGGVIRDVLGVSAKPIAATDIFCFGPQDTKTVPDGVLHPRRVKSGVIAGVQDYGNKIGIPTVNGTIYYDEGYIANPLVYCGCVGLAPKNSHPRAPQPGDHIIVIGGRTGRDGLRGATFSSMTMDTQTEEIAGTVVQIGDPIEAKGLIEVVTRARDAKLYTAITDCGAGGLSSAVGEMASELGADVDLTHVPLKYAGLAPWEIWLSEAQERMVLAVPEKNIAALKNICKIFDVELTDIGTLNNTKQITISYAGEIVGDLSLEFLFEGMPRLHLTAVGAPPMGEACLAPTVNNQHLLALLAHPNIASKEDVIRGYDHEVQGGTVIKPLVGIKSDGPSDACVLKPIGTKGLRGIAISNGINPNISDPYRMAISVIDEAIRNLVAVGANPDHIAILDNFCWGDPKRPETLGSLVEACKGCYDAAVLYNTPFISGKDSLNNEYYAADGQRHAIPATLLISAISIVEDVTQTITMDFKKSGNYIYLVGEGNIDLSPNTPQIYRTLYTAIKNKLVQSCHDLSEGGLAVAIAEMCIAGRLGCRIQTDKNIFSEVNSSFVVEIREQDCAAFEKLGLPIQKLGQITDNPILIINDDICLEVEQMVNAWQNSPAY